MTRFGGITLTSGHFRPACALTSHTDPPAINLPECQAHADSVTQLYTVYELYA